MKSDEKFIWNGALVILLFYTEVRKGSKYKDNDVACWVRAVSRGVLSSGRVNAQE